MGKATSETSNTTILPFNNIDINFDMFTVPESDIANIPISGDGENSDRINSSIFSIISIDENGEFHTYCSKICNVCWLTFDNDESLSHHKLNCRPPEFPTSPVKTPVTTDTKRCKKCKLLFPDRDSILAHVRECAKTELEEMANRMKLNSSQEKVSKLSNNQKPVTNEWKYTKSPLGKKPVNSIYPRECQLCKKTYLNKFSFYHHKKWCNGADNKHENEIPKIQYPRICTFCGKSCGSKFTFFRHKKQCIKQWSDANANAELANENGNEVTNIGILDTNERSDQNMQIAAQPESNHRNETIVESESHNDETLESRYSIDFVDSNTIASSENTSQENYASQSLDDDGKSLDESENEEDPFDDRCFEEICAYPKLCVHCQMFFADDLEYEQHKQNCFGFAVKNKSSKITYPRKCDICFNWYKSKETFIRHKKSCSPEWSKDRILPMYPRVCQFCRKTYATKHTFHAHKQRCIPVSPIILTNDQNSNYSTPSPCESLITYPRECENCLGTFQNADTFNAHKIRCDFFEPGIENENRNVFSQLNCEHCRNILGQYRRIFHQHIRQCDEPMFSSFRQKQLYQNAVPPFSPKSTIPSLTNEIIQISNETSTKAYPRGTHFCDCCGEFFTTAKKLEDHKRSVRSSTETLENLFDSFSKYQEVDNANVNNFKCGTCLEIFVNAECLEEHKRKCLPKFANTFYPRICECCNKIMKTEQIFYNHKQFCHPNCLKIFVRKDCEICSTSFKCEKLFLQHKLTCNVSLDNVGIDAEYEVLHSECDISI